MKKKVIIKKLIQARGKILDLIEMLSEEKWDIVFLGKWNLKDLVAHLIGWDFWNLKATKEIIKGRLPSYYKHYNQNWTKFNDALVKEYKKGVKNELLLSVKQSHRKLVDKLEKIPEEVYNKDCGLYWRSSKITLASNILYEARDEEEHAKQIRKWLGKS